MISEDTNQISALCAKSALKTGTSILGAATLLSLLSQVALPLGFTPVPLTGQSFGVALVSLLMGRKRAVAAVSAYLSFGALGLPVFAHGTSGLTLGPTLGYLVGMLVASWVIGGLADQGWASSFKSAWFACLIGSAFIFAFGLVGLCFFIPFSKLVAAGVLPFIPGDLIKTTLAASIASQIRIRRPQRAEAFPDF